jgi:hypothetical protein
MTLRQGFDPLILTATGLACRRGERVLARARAVVTAVR